MKKKSLLVIIGMVLALTACGQAAETTGEVPATTENAQVETTVEEKTADNTESASNENVITDNVISSDLFEITIPDELSGLFEAEVSEDRINIYHKASREAGFPGLVFAIWARKSPSEYAGGPYYKRGEILSADGDFYDVVKGEATEVQWDYNQEEPEDFEKIYQAAESIIENMTATNGGSFFYGSGMKGEDLYPYTLATFIDALTMGYDAAKLEEMGYAPDYYGIMQQYGEEGLSKIGYAYADVNVDSIDELFIGDIETGAIYDIFTMVDRQVTHVISGGARDRYYIYNDSFLCNEYSGGANESGWTLYALENNSTELNAQWSYKYDGYENEENPWFKSYDMKEWTPITEDEYNEALKQEENHADVGFKPLSDLAPVDFSKVDMSQYATFTELVSSLKNGMGYANVTLDGTDVLLVSSGCYNWDGIDAAIDAAVFTYIDGKVVYLGSVQSTGTANPLVISDGKLISAGHHFVTKSTVTDGKLVVAEEAYEEFDSDGNATYYYNSKKVDDDKNLQRMFEEEMNAEIIEFQPVAG